LLKFLDPYDVHVAGCIQEMLVFLIVAATLALGGFRINQLLRRQAEVVRERASLARYFPPNIVEESPSMTNRSARCETKRRHYVC